MLQKKCKVSLIIVKIGGIATQKKPNATANFKFGTGFFRFFWVFLGFFSVFPFWSILTGLTASC